MFLALLPSTQIICAIWKCVSPCRLMAMQFGCGCKVKSSSPEDGCFIAPSPACISFSTNTLAGRIYLLQIFLFSVSNAQSGIWFLSAVLETLRQPVQTAARAYCSPSCGSLLCAHEEANLRVASAHQPCQRWDHSAHWAVKGSPPLDFKKAYYFSNMFSRLHFQFHWLVATPEPEHTWI